MLLFGAIVAVYVRLGRDDAEDALIVRHGFLKAALATIFCLTSFYLLDLYDFIVMHDRRELVLAAVAGPRSRWIALAIAFLRRAAGNDWPRGVVDRFADCAAADGGLAAGNSLGFWAIPNLASEF